MLPSYLVVEDDFLTSALISSGGREEGREGEGRERGRGEGERERGGREGEREGGMEGGERGRGEGERERAGREGEGREREGEELDKTLGKNKRYFLLRT